MNISKVILSVIVLLFASLASGQNQTASFTVPISSDSVYKSQSGLLTHKYNAQKWEIMDRKINQFGEASFAFKTGDAFALIVTEKTPVPFKNLETVIFMNARMADEAALMLRNEIIKVNSIYVKSLSIKGSFKGISFISEYYVFSSAAGTVQIVVFSPENQYNEFRKDYEDFLNGAFFTDEKLNRN